MSGRATPPPGSRSRLSRAFTATHPVATITAMAVVSHGIDMVECSRMGELVGRYGERFLKRVFTQAELAYCRGRRREIEHLAGRFAVKEAVLKVLGTGWRKGINWTDVEVTNEPSGQPRVSIRGRCREVADERHITDILVSISHIETHAIGSAVAVNQE